MTVGLPRLPHAGVVEGEAAVQLVRDGEVILVGCGKRVRVAHELVRVVVAVERRLLLQRRQVDDLSTKHGYCME